MSHKGVKKWSPMVSSSSAEVKAAGNKKHEDVVINLTEDDDEELEVNKKERRTTMTSKLESEVYTNNAIATGKQGGATTIGEKCKRMVSDCKSSCPKNEVSNKGQIIQRSTNTVQMDKGQQKTMIDAHSLNVLLRKAFLAGINSQPNKQNSKQSTLTPPYDCSTVGCQQLGACRCLSKPCHSKMPNMHSRNDAKRTQLLHQSGPEQNATTKANYSTTAPPACKSAPLFFENHPLGDGQGLRPYKNPKRKICSSFRETACKKVPPTCFGGPVNSVMMPQPQVLQMPGYPKNRVQMHERQVVPADRNNNHNEQPVTKLCERSRYQPIYPKPHPKGCSCQISAGQRPPSMLTTIPATTTVKYTVVNSPWVKGQVVEKSSKEEPKSANGKESNIEELHRTPDTKKNHKYHTHNYKRGEAVEPAKLLAESNCPTQRNEKGREAKLQELLKPAIEPAATEGGERTEPAVKKQTSTYQGGGDTANSVEVTKTVPPPPPPPASTANNINAANITNNNQEVNSGMPTSTPMEVTDVSGFYSQYNRNSITLVSACRFYICQSIQQPNAVVAMLRVCIKCSCNYTIACGNIVAGICPIDLSQVECPRCWNSNSCYCGQPFSDRYISRRVDGNHQSPQQLNLFN